MRGVKAEELNRLRAISAELERVRTLDRWLSWSRLLAVPLAISQVALTDSFPPGYRTGAWAVCGALAAGALAIFALSGCGLDLRARKLLGASALAFDTAIVFALIFIFAFESGQPLWSLYYLPILEGALRFGPRAGIALPFATAPLIFLAELFRSGRFGSSAFRADVVAIRVAVGLLIGFVVGVLVSELVEQTRRSEARAVEAEELRDELGRRVDLLDAANRCARALGSSLELEQAFSAFIRELRGLVPFDRVGIVVVDGGATQVMATAGAGAETVFPPGTAGSVLGSILADVMQGQTVYRKDMSDARYAEERQLLALGLRCRLSAPLLVGRQPIGMLSLLRAEQASFSAEDVELVSLLGRLVATAVQNIRAYEAERSTVEELRRLSALRADFVSLVSHELRSPMAAALGAAQTLRQRWQELMPEQRESLLALIADETTRLTGLVGDVLDASRIEAGTFSYSFREVDVGELVRESVAAAELGQDEARVQASLSEPLPPVRGDHERLRQVLQNLIENALKYSSPDEAVEVAAYALNGRLCVDVRDQGPGIAPEHQGLIFEKFGRVKTDSSTPGSGLGLFIARSIAEAHGGSLEVRSALGRGATFTLALPLS